LLDGRENVFEKATRDRVFVVVD